MLNRRLEAASLQLQQISAKVQGKKFRNASVECLRSEGQRAVIVDNTHLVVLDDTHTLRVISLREKYELAQATKLSPSPSPSPSAKSPSPQQPTSVACVLDTPLWFEPNGMILSPGGRLLLLFDSTHMALVQLDPMRFPPTTSSKHSHPLQVSPVASTLFQNRPGAKILQVMWHPVSDGHLMLLTSDSRFWIYDVSKDLEREEQNVVAKFGESESPAVSFALGAYARGWDTFSVYFLTTVGELFVLCPLAPYGLIVPCTVLNDLVSSAQQTVYQDQGENAYIPASGATAAPVGTIPQGAPLSAADESVRRLSFGISPSPMSRNQIPASKPSESEQSVNSAQYISYVGRQAKMQLLWLQESFGHEVLELENEAPDQQKKVDAEFMILFKPMTAKRVPLLPQGPLSLNSAEALKGTALAIACLENPPGPPIFLISYHSPSRIAVVLGIDSPEGLWDVNYQGLDADVPAMTDNPGLALSMVVMEHLDLAPPNSEAIPLPLQIILPKWKRSDAFLVKSITGIMVIRMPWLKAAAKDDASALIASGTSTIHPLVVSNGSFSIAAISAALNRRGNVVLSISHDWIIAISTMRKAPSSWSLSTELSDAFAKAANVSNELTDISEDKLPETAFEKHVAEIMNQLSAVPKSTFLNRSFAAQQSMTTVSKFLQQILEQAQNAHVKSFFSLSSLLSQQSEHLISQSKEQVTRLHSVNGMLDEASVASEKTRIKIAKLKGVRENLKRRVEVVTARIQQALAKADPSFSAANLKFANSVIEKQKAKDNVRQEIQEIGIASKTLIDQFKKSADRPRGMTMRSQDLKRIHEALYQHGDTLASLLDQSAELWARLERFPTSG